MTDLEKLKVARDAARTANAARVAYHAAIAAQEQETDR
jgi:hypothetical protein